METIKKFLFITLLAFSLTLSAADPININSADKQTLMLVKGVGEKRAEAIIAWREKNGPFKSVDDLIQVEGIGQATLDTNREMLTIGTSTAQ